MKKNEFKATLLVLAGLSSFAALTWAADKSSQGTKVTGGLLIPAANVKWSDVPGTAGVQIAAVDGDPGKGPSHLFLKFPAGSGAPLHHHTADHFGTVVTGTLVLNVDGKEQKLATGSFFELDGKAKHSTRCEPGADCVVSLDVRGKWDVVPDGGQAATKK